MSEEQAEQLEETGRVPTPSNEISLGAEDDLTFTVNFEANGQEATAYTFDVMEAVIKLEELGFNKGDLNMGQRVEIFKQAVGLPDISPSYGVLILTAFEKFLGEVGKKPLWQPILGLPTESKLPRCSGTDEKSSLSAYTRTPQESEQSNPSQ